LAFRVLYSAGSCAYDAVTFVEHKFFTPAQTIKIFRGRLLAGTPWTEPGDNMRPKRTILCVDDNEQALSIRKLMLETRGYRVLACTGGQQAWDVFRQGGIDLVLSDLLMPGMDGAELVDKVKDSSPQTPAILFSGKVKAYEKETRADLFLPKGMYAPVELLEKMRILLVKKRGPKRAGSAVALRMPAAG